MKKILSLLLCFSILHCGSLKAQALEDYMKIAAENNPGLKAAYLEFETAMQRVAQVNALPDPTLSMGYFISPVETRVGPQIARFSLTQMFPWFGTLALKESSASLQAEVKYQLFLNARNALFYEVKLAWYPLFENKKTLVLQKANLEILNSMKDIGVNAFQNGKGQMTDVLKVDLKILEIETQIENTKSKFRTLQTQFNILLNREDTMAIELPNEIEIPDLPADYRADSLMSNPLFAAYNLRQQVYETQTELVHKQGLPNFGVGLDYVIVNKRTDMSMPDNGKNVIMPMLTLSLPLHRARINAGIKETELMQMQNKAMQMDLVNDLKGRYTAAAFQWTESKRLLALYQKQIEKTKEIITLQIAQYSNNGSDFESVLQLQTEQLNYALAIARETSNCLKAIAEIDYISNQKEQL